MSDADAGLWVYRAEMLRVIDADTVVVVLDLGFSARYEAAIRLAGVDAPELSTPAGKAARSAVSDLIWKAALAAKVWPLRVRTLRTAAGTDARSFARWVGSITVLGADGPIDLADWLVANGHAVRVGKEERAWAT